MPEEPETLSLAVNHRRGAFHLDVTFTVSAWPAVLFGPSGSGKSTLLRILAGLEHADEARITLGSRILADTAGGVRNKPGRGGVQIVTQRAALFPNLPVRENIAFGLPRPQRRAAAPVDELLALLKIERLASHKPHQLSGGELQRVALARALAPRPRLLLLDEAFTGLDGMMKEEIFADLSMLLAQTGVPALHVTHEVSDAFLLQAEVIVIENGRFLRQGAAAAVLALERQRIMARLAAGALR